MTQSRASRTKTYIELGELEAVAAVEEANPIPDNPPSKERRKWDANAKHLKTSQHISQVIAMLVAIDDLKVEEGLADELDAPRTCSRRSTWRSSTKSWKTFAMWPRMLSTHRRTRLTVGSTSEAMTLTLAYTVSKKLLLDIPATN